MGHFLGFGDKSVFVDEDGRYWDNQYKRNEIDPSTIFQNDEKKADENSQPEMKCNRCDFIGKNKQSLFLHTLKKHGVRL